MIRTVEAIIDASGRVRLLAPIQLDGPCRALVTILDEPGVLPNEAILQAEPALADDWSRPEEDRAWAHLQPHRPDSDEGGVGP